MFRNLIVASVVLFASSSAFAACSITVDGNDAMQFDVKSIEVPKTCKDFTVNLTHSGKLAKNVMGHNWVLTTTADFQPSANDGMAAGLDKEYVKSDDTRSLRTPGYRCGRNHFGHVSGEQADRRGGLHVLLFLPRPFGTDEGQPQARLIATQQG